VKTKSFLEELIIVAGIVATTCIAVLSIPQTVSAAPSGWKYERPITLTPATPVADYQIMIELDNDNFDYSKADPEGDDIRFYDTGDNKLSYWIETWDNTGTSIIWVKVPTSGTSTIYMYYGNPSATSESNGDNVFDFFDDFNDGVWTDKWDEIQSDESSYVTENGGTIKLVSSGPDSGPTYYEYIDSKTSFEVPFIYETRFKFHPSGYSTSFSAQSNVPVNSHIHLEDTRYGSDYRAFLIGGVLTLGLNTSVLLMPGKSIR